MQNLEVSFGKSPFDLGISPSRPSPSGRLGGVNDPLRQAGEVKMVSVALRENCPAPLHPLRTAVLRLAPPGFAEPGCAPRGGNLATVRRGAYAGRAQRMSKMCERGTRL